MFRQSHAYSNLDEAVAVLQSAHDEVRRLYSEVVKLVRCLLALPVSSCEAERSFSALRRLKTFLRSTMTQKRLNNIAVCHIHKERLDDVSMSDVAKDFISLNQRRSYTFGAGVV